MKEDILELFLEAEKRACFRAFRECLGCLKFMLFYRWWWRFKAFLERKRSVKRFLASGSKGVKQRREENG